MTHAEAGRLGGLKKKGSGKKSSVGPPKPRKKKVSKIMQEIYAKNKAQGYGYTNPSTDPFGVLRARAAVRGK